MKIQEPVWENEKTLFHEESVEAAYVVVHREKYNIRENSIHKYGLWLPTTIKKSICKQV
jgi:hypothetical protein